MFWWVRGWIRVLEGCVVILGGFWSLDVGVLVEGRVVIGIVFMGGSVDELLGEMRKLVLGGFGRENLLELMFFFFVYWKVGSLKLMWKLVCVLSVFLGFWRWLSFVVFVVGFYVIWFFVEEVGLWVGVCLCCYWCVLS